MEERRREEGRKRGRREGGEKENSISLNRREGRERGEMGEVKEECVKGKSVKRREMRDGNSRVRDEREE